MRALPTSARPHREMVPVPALTWPRGQLLQFQHTAGLGRATLLRHPGTTGHGSILKPEDMQRQMDSAGLPDKAWGDVPHWEEHREATLASHPAQHCLAVDMRLIRLLIARWRLRLERWQVLRSGRRRC